MKNIYEYEKLTDSLGDSYNWYDWRAQTILIKWLEISSCEQQKKEIFGY